LLLSFKERSKELLRKTYCFTVNIERMLFMNGTRFGLSENVEGALAYVFGIVSGIFFLIIENNNQFVKFHSLQSIMFFVGIAVFNFIISTIFIVPVFGFFKIIVCGFVALVSFIVYIILIIMAYCGRTVKIPIIGEWAWMLSFK